MKDQTQVWQEVLRAFENLYLSSRERVFFAEEQTLTLENLYQIQLFNLIFFPKNLRTFSLEGKRGIEGVQYDHKQIGWPFSCLNKWPL